MKIQVIWTQDSCNIILSPYLWCLSWTDKLPQRTFIVLPTSGVSAGQIIPHSVLWSCRGLASLPSRPMGELRRRKCESVDANVSLLSTWDTPALAWWAFFWSPQLPVAKEYFNPSVMIRVLIANSKLKSLPRSMNFCEYIRTSLFKFLNNLQMIMLYFVFLSAL